MASAAEDFRRARQQAQLQEIVSFFTGHSAELLSFEEVRRALKAQSSRDRGITEIPLDAIVGSVNRYTDFTRNFLPRQSVDAQRWAKVEAISEEASGWPPIEVYKIGDVYFVKDGNHRVSAARQIGFKTISAYVTEVYTPVPLTPDIRPEDLILKAEYAEFLEHTHLNTLRPEADLSVSVPGQYDLLEEHIKIHHYFMGLDFQREISQEEAIAHWYDTVYMPVVEIIRRQGILRDFPGRTETDLYLWIAEHRAVLEKNLGWEISSEAAATDLAEQRSPRPSRVAARLSGKLAGALLPSSLGTGPEIGQWRREKLSITNYERLFSDILVPVNGASSGWQALEMAFQVARLEKTESGQPARLHGLHVVQNSVEKESEPAKAVQAEFDRRCQEAGIPGRLVLTAGEVARKISNRARWNDLVVVNLAFPPAQQPLAALSSGFRSLIQHCPRPILAPPLVEGPVQKFSKALLAFDGSPKSREALFIATYIATKWGFPLGVISITENGDLDGTVQADARLYLETHEVQAEYIQERGPVPETIIRVAESGQYDLLLMGGYGRHPLLDVVLGSNVDQVLRESRKPLLICR